MKIISFLGSIIVLIALKKASAVYVEDENQDANQNQNPPQSPETELSPEKWKVLAGTGKVLSLLALCATGALQPSIPSVVYYLVFLGAASWWGCNKGLER